MKICRMFSTGAMLAAFLALALATGATAQVRDAVYRGTLVCPKLPFFEAAAREAIEVTISGGAVRYTIVVWDRAEISSEKGAGTLDGDKITLQGSWYGSKNSYQASYSGTFVRRSAKLTGTQVWPHEGVTHHRTCMGAIKRPFAIFLPKQKNKPADDDDDDDE